MDKAEKRISIRIEGLKKQYRVGQIGGRTLQNELKSWWALKRGKEDPNTKIGQTGRLRGETFMALDGIDLTAYRGEAVGIIGRNGAGKSTLLKLISRITAPTEGTIDLYGRVASMLEVGTGFNGEMTGRENIYLNGAILGMTKNEITEKLDDIIEFSEIGEFIDTPVKRYSSGMYVKLAFSVAAHLESEILIMDEVLAVGDMEFQKKCLRRMRDEARVNDRTVFYVSHNMNTIRSLCDRCIVLDEGKVVFDGDVDKAIAIYLGTESSEKTTFVFNKNYRPYADINRRRQMDIKSLTIMNKGGAVFSTTEKQELKIVCSAGKTLERVGFRLELWYQDGTKTGSMLSETFVDIEAGENTVMLTVDPSHLTGGQYMADLLAYQFDDDGNETILDGVYPGIVFNIEDKLGETSHLDWHNQYWGNVHLHDMIVERK